jgi:hypothetical protein
MGQSSALGSLRDESWEEKAEGCGEWWRGSTLGRGATGWLYYLGECVRERLSSDALVRLVFRRDDQVLAGLLTTVGRTGLKSAVRDHLFKIQ